MEKVLIPGMKEVQMLWSNDKKKEKEKKKPIRTSVPQFYPSLTAYPPVSGF